MKKLFYFPGLCYDNINEISKIPFRRIKMTDIHFDVLFVLSYMSEQYLSAGKIKILRQAVRKGIVGKNQVRKLLKNGNGSESISTFRDEYDFLSNFYPCSIVYQGMWYQNAEAAFQAQKCINEEDKQVFCGLPAAKAKRHGRQVKLRPDWESVKIGLMAEIVKAKFSQNIHLAKKLLATGTGSFLRETHGATLFGA